MPNNNVSTPLANLMVNIFDGTRRLFSDSVKILIRIIDGNQTKRYEGYRKGPSIFFKGLPVSNNFGDNYTVVVWAKGYRQIGFTPIKISQGTTQHIDLMLLPENGSFNFNRATWKALKDDKSTLYKLLRSGVKNEKSAKDRYDKLRENHSEIVASFLNITTAVSQIFLSDMTPLDYLKELIWKELKQDRFFAYADTKLIEQIERAAAQGLWAPEIGSSIFHPGATKSFKQIQFGEANVQITFHEKNNKLINDIDCVKVELDIDYYKDIGAHALLEVLPNTLTGQKTDPKTVYVLRWNAGRQAGIPEFDPPYVIV